MRTMSVTAMMVFGFGAIVLAQHQPKTAEEAQALVKSLKFQEGQISLSNGLATLNVPPGFRFLDGPDANKIVVNLWGNPPGKEPLGMLMPAATSPLSHQTWAVIITYSEDGYVKDQDAEKINYDALLKNMKKGVHEANAERTKEGYPAMELVGWAAPPRYDRDSHKLYWAKELSFEGEHEKTLNYSIRMLGRRGVLVLNAVSGMSELPQIESAAPEIIRSIDFNPGNRYADFSQTKGDKVATYGLAALVAGGVAAKLGLFKGLWLLLLGAKKLIIIAVAAIGTWIRKLLGRKPPAVKETPASP